MILTNCAACAAPLAHDAPRCIRCWTRYCDAACQHDHWRRGHKQICKKIHRGGNAEQYYADKKYKEAVAEAVEACAEDTKGQKCYICLEAVHPHTGEGLVRGCACGDRDGVSSPELGVAHVTCLARQAKEMVAEAKENNLGDKAFNERWWRWDTCSLCEQSYHGVVAHALGWACWKTYANRGPLRREDVTSVSSPLSGSMILLGDGLDSAGHVEAALSVFLVLSDAQRRLAPNCVNIALHGRLASCYSSLGRHEESLRINRDLVAIQARGLGPSHLDTLRAANNLANALRRIGKHHIAEARSLMRKTIELGTGAYGSDDATVISHRWTYAETLFKIEAPSLDDLIEAESVLEDVTSKMNRVFGSLHPHTVGAGQDLARVRDAIARKRAAPEIPFDLKTPERSICKSRRPPGKNT